MSDHPTELSASACGVDDRSEKLAKTECRLQKDEQRDPSVATVAKRRLGERRGDSTEEKDGSVLVENGETPNRIEEKEQPSDETEKKCRKKARKNRCGQCQCRLSLVWQSIQCRCGLSFCEKHRHPVMSAERFDKAKQNGHLCMFDYAGEARKTLGEQLVRVDTNSGLKTRL